MTYLLDTHALLWWLMADPRLSPASRAAIEDEAELRFVSVVTAFEIATKSRIGKLEPAKEILASFDAILKDAMLETLDLTLEHAILAGQMPVSHKDPFDRLLAAQAMQGGYVLISADAAFAEFAVERLW